MDKGTAYHLGKSDYKAGRASNPQQCPDDVQDNYWVGWDAARIEAEMDEDERRTEIVPEEVHPVLDPRD